MSKIVDGMKYCTGKKHKKFIPVGEFGKCAKNGLQYMCRSCYTTSVYSIKKVVYKERNVSISCHYTADEWHMVLTNMSTKEMRRIMIDAAKSAVLTEVLKRKVND